MKIRFLLLPALLCSVPLATAQPAISDDATRLFSLAEQLLPALFKDGGDLKQTQGYAYRYYSGTGVYVGIKDEQVSVMGGSFGPGITAKGSVASLLGYLQQVQSQRRAAARSQLTTQVKMNWNANGATSTGRVTLTQPPMQLSDVANIVPLGLMAAGHVTPVDHMYFGPLDFNSAPATYPVYVVAPGRLTEISTRPTSKGGVEYRVVLQHTGTFYSYYDLIDVLDPAISAQIPAGALDNGRIFHGAISVTAGQLLGRIGGKTLDFANVDLESFLSGFIDPASYLREPWKPFTVDTFAAYDEPLRSQLLAKVQRVTEPRGGKIDYDMAGTLSGNWFKAGTNGYAGIENDTSGKPYWAGHLAVVPYWLDPQYIVVSLGDFNGEAKQFGVRGNAPAPASVTAATGVVKWELTQPPNGPPPLPDMSQAQSYGTVLLQVLSGERLKVEVFPGKTPAQVSGFTGAAALYGR